MKSIDNTKSRMVWPFGVAPSAHARGPQFCLLCGGPQDVIGVYVPDNPEAWGAPKGKDRRFVYALCGDCFGKPDAPTCVEKIIKSEVYGGYCPVTLQ